MIHSIELIDFLAHHDTKLEFNNDATVFVGQNGAGKSSIIDAITFSLFGSHMRKNNKSLIRRGANKALVKVEFSANGKKYRTVRQIDAKGTLTAQFLEKNGGDYLPIAEGERKQFGESMTNEVEKVLGMNFEKLKIASIVQQGELNSIIKAKPKEFKELLNTIIGIDRLDVAVESMKEVLKEFRKDTQNKHGFDDTQIELLENKMSEFENEILNSKPKIGELEQEKKTTETEISQIEQEIEKDSMKESQLVELENQKEELVSYAKDAIKKIQKEVMEEERKVNECKDCFSIASEKEEIEIEISKLNLELSAVMKDVDEYRKKKIRFEEQSEFANRLELREGKCPVCDSKVDHLNPLFQKEHVEEEIRTLGQKLIHLEDKKLELENLIQEKTDRLRKAENADVKLKTHNISNETELEQIVETVKEKITTTARPPNMMLAIPVKNSSGTNTATCVKLDATMAVQTSSLPLTEAVMRSCPCSM